MSWPYNTRYPAIADLRKKAAKRIPKFAFEYLDGGCNEDINLDKNIRELHEIELMPRYLEKGNLQPSLTTRLFGVDYDAPFGVAPVGLQGLIWPNATEILAQAAFEHNLPFILSTVTTASIEKVAQLTQSRFWFQLYYPAAASLRNDILQRLNNVNCQVLVLLSDVPAFGYRPRDIRNGLAMPPRMTLQNMVQIATHPHWALRTLFHGQPSFATLKPYMPANLNMKQLGQFMNKTFDGKLTRDKIAAIRDQWKGKLVLKGVSAAEDVEAAISLGLDGVIVSNHGGRQLDAAPSAIASLQSIYSQYKDKLTIMMDSGIRSGPDIARAMASGADFTFLGRSFMYGVAALGQQGGSHTMAILKTQLMQLLQQLCCESPSQFKHHLHTTA